MHTLIEGRQLTTAIQSTKRRGAGQVDPSTPQSPKRRKKKKPAIRDFCLSVSLLFLPVISGCFAHLY
jgi:hypothetical protein